MSCFPRVAIKHTSRDVRGQVRRLGLLHVSPLCALCGVQTQALALPVRGDPTAEN